MLCYNIGCAKNFDPNDNKIDSCRFHPKPPIFHDGRKGWECCNKYTTDFSTCINLPGCQTGFHNNKKPIEEPKIELDKIYDVDVVVVEPTKPEPKKERSSDTEEMHTLIISEAANVRSVLQQRRAQLTTEAIKNLGDKSENIAYGTHCNNTGCNAIYKGGDSNKDICMYHNGVAIFHEGMKYWSCCARKTTEFDSFMAQEGCTSGCHLWFKERKAECRMDWFQTGGCVTLTFYAKVPVPDTVKVTANGVKLVANFEFDGGQSLYERSFTLFEVIEPEKCTVKVFATKIEVVLKKRDISSWKNLEWSPVTN